MNTGFARSTDKRFGASPEAKFVLLLLFIAVAGQASLMAQSAGTFTATGNMTRPRVLHTATLLQDGRVLIAGGSPSASAELYDPSTGTFTATGNMTTARSGHTATLLPGGMVLIAGGYTIGGGAPSSAELYDPSTGTFAATGMMTVSRSSHTATLLNTGKVLIAAGSPVTNAELYDPSTGTFTATGSMTKPPYSLTTANLLPDGRVLIAEWTEAEAEIYDPGTGTFSLTEPRNPWVQGSTASLQSGKVLFAGGNDDPGESALATVFDPSTGTFTATGNMTIARADVPATLLPDGTVLIAGSKGSYDITLASAEVYDPSTGTFTATGNMTTDRGWHTATLLNNGSVLIAGGLRNLTPFDGHGGAGADTILASAEVYHPAGIQFTPKVQIVDNNTGSRTTLAVGDSFSFLVNGAPPFSLVFVSEPGWSASVGYTDASGLFWLNGIVGSNVVGTWQQTWTIGGVSAQPGPLQFTITPKP
jgi:galactose oxidase-like protein